MFGDYDVGEFKRTWKKW